MKDLTIEICAGSVTDVITANAFDEVDRIELNCALELGGLTPSLHTFLRAKQTTNKKIVCMVRPRPAGFVYNAEEINTMFADARTFLEYDADGIVFGFLNSDLTIDEDTTLKMVSLIHGYGKEAVFHKAFDETIDAKQALQTLIELGVDRVLTSGQRPTTLEGADMIAELQENYGDLIEILPGGGITEKTILPILKKTHCPRFHMTAKESLEDRGSYFAVSSNQIRKVLLTIQDLCFENKHTKTREDIALLQEDAYEK